MFLGIVNNSKDLFQQKFEKLSKLNDQYEKEQMAKQTKLEIQDSLNVLQNKIQSFENEGADMEYKLRHFKDTSEARKINRMKPTEKIMSKLQKWEEQLDSQYMDTMDQEKFSNELWTNNEQIDKQMLIEDKGWEREKRYWTSMYELKIQKMKEHFQFHIQSQESAMIELKSSS